MCCGAGRQRGSDRLSHRGHRWWVQDDVLHSPNCISPRRLLHHACMGQAREFGSCPLCNGLAASPSDRPTRISRNPRTAQISKRISRNSGSSQPQCNGVAAPGRRHSIDSSRATGRRGSASAARGLTRRPPRPRPRSQRSAVTGSPQSRVRTRRARRPAGRAPPAPARRRLCCAPTNSYELR